MSPPEGALSQYEPPFSAFAPAVDAGADAAVPSATPGARTLTMGSPFADDPLFGPLIAANDGGPASGVAEDAEPEQSWEYVGAVPYAGETPEPWTPTIPATPPPASPKAVTPSRERPPLFEPICPGSHHAPDPVWAEPPPVYGLGLGRRFGWDAYQGAAGELRGTWNTVVALHLGFELTEEAHREELREVHNLRVDDGEANAHTAANHTPASRNGKANELAVGDLFHNESIAGRRISTGTEVELSSKAERGIDRAAGQVNAEIDGLRAADATLAAAVGDVRAQAETVEACQHDVVNALDKIESTAAAEALTAAQGAASAVAGEVAEAKKTVKEVIGVIKGITGIVAFAAGPAGAAAGAAGMAKTTGSMVGASVVESIANRMIDGAYAGRLKSAGDAVRAATGRVDKARRAEDASHLAGTQSRLDAAIAQVTAMIERVKAALADRRQAYEALGAAAARQSGARAGSHAFDEIRGAIAAIPVVDTLVGKCEGVRDAAVPPAYVRLAGQGLAMAIEAGQPHATEFLAHVGHVRYYRSLYEDRAGFWSARKQSLAALVERLAANG